jgi:hypothetical protein
MESNGDGFSVVITLGDETQAYDCDNTTVLKPVLNESMEKIKRLRLACQGDNASRTGDHLRHGSRYPALVTLVVDNDAVESEMDRVALERKSSIADVDQFNARFVTHE